MALQGIKDFYYSLEEKWYSALDKIDARVPIYWGIDAIDSVIPSLVLFILLAILILGFGAYFLVSLNQSYPASFIIKTYDNKPIYDTLITAKVMQGGSLIDTQNQRTDAEGRVTFTNLHLGQAVQIDINISKGSFSGSFDVARGLEETIFLSKPSGVANFEAVAKRIVVKNASGFIVSDPVRLNFSCEGSSLSPTPSSATFNGSAIEVTQPAGCQLLATAVSSKYKQRTYQVNSTLYDLILDNLEPTTVQLKITVRYLGFPVNDTSFKVKLSGQNNYESDTKGISEATLNVEQGTYFLSITDPNNKYGMLTDSIEVQKNTELVEAVTKTVQAKVSVRTIDARSNSSISGAIVNVKDSIGREVSSETTDSNGSVLFSFADLGEYTFAAKKPGDVNSGYFVKEITQQITGDASITLSLDAITQANAGKTVVQVVDQDGLPVTNARVMLLYKQNDGIVELLQAKNYSMSDANGEAELIAGSVSDFVYAYAIKGPFKGSSLDKKISVDQLNSFKVQLDLGIATVRINVKDEEGKSIDGTAEIFAVEDANPQSHGISGLVSVESGTAARQIKAGQSVYVKVSSETFEDYYTAPVMLYPNKTYTFDVVLAKQISAPAVKLVGLYNENGALVQTMAPGKEYYAKLLLSSDSSYNEALLNFRAGKEDLVENDAVSIDYVEAANVFSEVRGTSYSPTKGYSFDGANTTDGPAKWINVLWKNPGVANREVKVWFKVNKDATPNKELQFFYRAVFDSTRVPESAAPAEFYADSYASLIYFVGAEAVCEGTFCLYSQWLYSQKDDLYIDQPYALAQLTKYNYHFTILNNSGIDYGAAKKPIYLSIKVLGDSGGEKRVKIDSYNIKDGAGSATTNSVAVYSAENIALNSFAKNTTIDANLSIEGLNNGAEAISVELKADGKIIYSSEASFGVVKGKDFSVDISPKFVSALLNTPLEVTVLDEKGDYLPGASVRALAKEPGYDEYLVDSAETDNLGRALVNSGTLFDKSKVVIEVTKEDYSRQRIELPVSSDAVAFDPGQVFVELNTFSKREDKKSITFANLTTHDLQLDSIILDAKLKDLINEDALNGYFNEIAKQDRTVKAQDTLDIDLLDIKLANNITSEGLTEPITLTGAVKAVFLEPQSQLRYDVNIPITINVSSQANPGEDCLVIDAGKTSAVTQAAQARFDFQITNACESDSASIPLDDLSVTAQSDVPGIAQVSLRNSAGSSVGVAALDGTKRILLNSVAPGEKLFGTVNFSPDAESVGKAVSLQMIFEAKFQGQSVRSNPNTVTYTVNVVNLLECMNIQSDETPAEFDGRAKITIDSSACLNQKIDVILCKNDSGCSGNTEGKIILSRKAFTTLGGTQTVEAYGPSLPGTYGVSIYARTQGTLGFTYIGEFPVSFREQDSRYFRLNKYELNLVGSGAADSALVENLALSESVRVKANECVWGKKDGEFSWGNAIAGALLGAQVGNMIGNSFGSNQAKYQGSVSKGGFLGIGSKSVPATITSNRNIIGGVATIGFALLGAFLLGSPTYHCEDNYQTGTFQSFVILLQGTTVSVAPPNDSGIGVQERVLEPDAGPLSFTLGQIKPEWDFTDAHYSSTELAAIKFTNNGLDDQQPRYGVLTVNATVHNHGNLIHSPYGSSIISTNSSDYDVFCNNANFGNYWIGSEENGGSCAGVSTTSYSQKYHLRVISAEPKGEEAFIKKASSCYFGALTGATGPEALPRTKLNWEWDGISSDACNYGNSDYIYCDGAQFTIALTKKLAALDEFLAINKNKLTCPPNVLEQQVRDTVDEVNNAVRLGVINGFVGVDDATINVASDHATATVKVNNKTGADVSGYVLSVTWDGPGDPATESRQLDIPAGVSTITFDADTPEFDGLYYFTATLNGPMSDRQTLNKAFTNRKVDENCWMPQTTRKEAGLPGVVYFVSAGDSISYTDKIRNYSDLYSSINFGAYLTKEAYTPDFLTDFKEYYRNKLLQTLNTDSTEKKLVDMIDSGKFKITTKFSGGNEIEAGLYDVWVNIDMPNNWSVTDNNDGEINVELLLVKKPSIDNPFYSIPFDGMLGERSGRQGYGAIYQNDDEKDITVSNAGTKVNTFYNSSSNGVMSITTKTSTSFDAVNASVLTRGQVAAVSTNGGSGELVLTPLFATPVILKNSIDSSSGRIAYSLENNNKAVATGSNIAYWTGAAKSKDYYGGNAVETFSDAPDYRLAKIGDNVYGFEFENASRSGSLYLKNAMFVPADGTLYNLVSKENNTSFWTPGKDFSPSIDLSGVPGMQFNSRADDAYIKSLQDLFDAVSNQEVCVSSDGQSASFWMNPKTLENTVGATDSLANEETQLSGAQN